MCNQTSDQEKCSVVVSQLMYFPWIGILEQIKLCDVLVYYNDVQFSRGFFNCWLQIMMIYLSWIQFCMTMLRK